MGWLEQLAKEREYKSLRAVALKMTKSDRWPAKDKRSPETVANKLRDADKGEDVAYWTTGAGRSLLPALAEVLGEEDEGDLLDRFQNEPSPSTSQSPAVWPFKMFPALRAIELHSEDPCPGVPPALVRVGGPREARTWWVAPTGAGKTLVGHWLEARYGWTFHQAESWADVELPTQGRVFVDLASTAGISVEAFEVIPAAVTICVACPNPPPEKSGNRKIGLYDNGVPRLPSLLGEELGQAVSPSLFTILYTPPAAVWADALIKWVTKRVKPGGGFDAGRVHELLSHEDMLALFETPGELIGFLGTVEYAGLARFEGSERQSKDPLWLVRIWLKALLERDDRRCAPGTTELFRICGSEMLRGMEMERLRRGLGPALCESCWIELVPRGHAPELNRDRLLSVINEAGTDALAQLHSLLAPDGASVVAGLEAAGVLARNCDAGHLRIKPAWVANAIDAIAVDSLYNDTPNGLGSLLLYETTSEGALRRLINDVCAGDFRRVEACLTAGEPASPEQMAALDGGFRAIGNALVSGVSLPTDWVHEVWARQMRYTFRRYSNWPPIPILQIAQESHHGATATSVWLFAAFSISRTLTDAGVDIGRSPLNPWCGLPEDAGERDVCIEALSSIGRIGRTGDETADRDPLGLLIYRLGAVLLERLGVLRRHTSLLELQHPDLLVALASGADLEMEGSEREDLLHLSFGLDALEEACQRRGVDLGEVLRWCWHKWRAQPDIWRWPPLRWLGRGGFTAKYKDAERIWKHVSADVLPDAFYQQLGEIPEVWLWLTEPIWARWLDVWSTQDGRWSKDAAVFSALPEALALQAVRDGRVDPWCHEVREVLWKRMPTALLDLVDELATLPPNPHPRLAGDGGPISSLVYVAPAEHCPRLVERALARGFRPHRPTQASWGGYAAGSPAWSSSGRLDGGRLTHSSFKHTATSVSSQ
ncbi:hypothetical protein [Polyangium aurulentum]|uniref:hypothetical protein n=1 Tax=Polyangium aurulentum TaxID=2567896 RepID=UPI0010AEA3E2|nr:hypothetical protein [Polyangium aurulentum]UQA61347.1 hypothetical protein E8A73_013075 [Polyangium aurulentum]